MGFRSISMVALRFVLLFALCVGVLSKIDRLEADIEDPADMADEFLNQMSYDKLDKDQDQGQMIASELQGLNDVASQTEDVSHPDMGESADVDVQLSEGVAQCNGDQECIDTVHAVVSSLGESMSGALVSVSPFSRGLTSDIPLPQHTQVLSRSLCLSDTSLSHSLSTVVDT